MLMLIKSSFIDDIELLKVNRFVNRAYDLNRCSYQFFLETMNELLRIKIIQQLKKIVLLEIIV